MRVYVPLDLSPSDIMRRLEHLVYVMGDASEKNESIYSSEVYHLIQQVEIYDRIVRERTGDGCNGLKKEFIEGLEAIPDACAECFPFGYIEELRMEWGIAGGD